MTPEQMRFRRLLLAARNQLITDILAATVPVSSLIAPSRDVHDRRFRERGESCVRNPGLRWEATAETFDALRTPDFPIHSIRRPLETKPARHQSRGNLNFFRRLRPSSATNHPDWRSKPKRRSSEELPVCWISKSVGTKS